ncbi:MAG: hypothetical protein AAF206_20330, partial [Bacteroidota bacterium]
MKRKFVMGNWEQKIQQKVGAARPFQVQPEWDRMAASLDAAAGGRKAPLWGRWAKPAAAASIVLLVGLSIGWWGLKHEPTVDQAGKMSQTAPVQEGLALIPKMETDKVPSALPDAQDVPTAQAAQAAQVELPSGPSGRVPAVTEQTNPSFIAVHSTAEEDVGINHSSQAEKLQPQSAIPTTDYFSFIPSQTTTFETTLPSTPIISLTPAPLQALSPIPTTGPRKWRVGIHTGLNYVPYFSGVDYRFGTNPTTEIGLISPSLGLSAYYRFDKRWEVGLHAQIDDVWFVADIRDGEVVDYWGTNLSAEFRTRRFFSQNPEQRFRLF